MISFKKLYEGIYIVNLNSFQINAMTNQYGSLENDKKVWMYCLCGYHAAKIIPVIDIKKLLHFHQQNVNLLPYRV